MGILRMDFFRHLTCFKVLLVTLACVLGSQGVRAQSNEPDFRPAKWQVIAQYFEYTTGTIVDASSPAELATARFDTPLLACKAGAAYVLPRLRQNNYSLAFNDGMEFSSLRPYGPMLFVVGVASEIPINGHKCAIKGYVTDRRPDTLYDIYEKGTKITTATSDDNNPPTWQIDNLWAGSIAAVPVCIDDSFIFNLKGQITCVSRNYVAENGPPDCEGADGDSPKSTPPKKCAGNPIAIDSGAKQQHDVDYATADGLLRVERKYRSNSRPTNLSDTVTEIPGFGTSWRGLLPGRITVKKESGYFWKAEYLNDEGGTRTFRFNNYDGGDYKFSVSATRTRLKLSTTRAVSEQSENPEGFFAAAPSANGDLRLDYANGDYILFRASGNWDAATQTRDYVPIKRVQADGYQQLFDYPDNGQYPNRIRDNLGRQLTVQWTPIGFTSTQLRNYTAAPDQSAPDDMILQMGISQIGLPDGTLLAYTYGPSTSTGFLGRLETAKHLDASGTVLWGRSYLYEDPRFRSAMTGMLDQDGARLSTYSYHPSGTTAQTERAGGFDRFTVDFNEREDTNFENGGQPIEERVVTNPYGLKTTYTYSGFTENYSSSEGSTGPDPRYTPRRLLKTVNEATPSVPERTQRFEYDDDGLQRTQTNANGAQTVRVNIPGEGRPASITDAAGVVTQIEWHPDLDLPVRQTRIFRPVIPTARLARSPASP
jgi:hypothetical protein